ncbi:MAG TPA: DUF4160 domain-containing protein [Thermoanaerobaculia bacterium]|nr:DUF4160 domain-containing protein [Thermoanaerobaculia bacterium]
MHVHVFSSEGEAKFRLRPSIELAENRGIPSREITVLAKIIERRADEIAAAWREHFGSRGNEHLKPWLLVMAFRQETVCTVF